MADLGSNGFTPEPLPYGDAAARGASILHNPQRERDYRRSVTLTYGAGLQVTTLGSQSDATMATKSGRVLWKLSGTTKLDGVATSGITVKAFDRNSGALLGSVVSGASGVFEIDVPGYDGTFPALVVALDPAGGGDYNATVKDKITSVAI